MSTASLKMYGDAQSVHKDMKATQSFKNTVSASNPVIFYLLYHIEHMYSPEQLLTNTVIF